MVRADEFSDPQRKRLGSNCNDPFEYLRVCSDDNERPERSAPIDRFFDFSNVDDSRVFFEVGADTLIGESKMLVHLGSHAARDSRDPKFAHTIFGTLHNA